MGNAVTSTRSASRRHLLAVLVIIVAACWAFEGVRRCGWVDWDDPQLLVENQAYRGLAWSNLRWMFTTGLGGHYQPLTWLSYAVDYVVWGGLSPSGIHLTNLLLHVLTAVLFYHVARRLIQASAPVEVTACSAGALAATVVFAIHPLRVESVAWATERRDVLSGAWLMLALVLYLRGHDRAGPSWSLGASILAFLAGLLSKASGMTLPFVLLVMDWYPLRRIGPRPDGAGREPVRSVIVEKLWFVGAAALSAGVALYAQWRSRALWSFEEHPLGLRLGQAAYGIVFYLWKMIWPANLIPLYEQDPQATALEPEYVGAAAMVAVISWLAWRLRRRLPAFSTTWLCYLLLLAPVLGLAQSGPQVAADRYTYLASMPWAVLLGGGIARLWASAGAARRPLRAISVVGLAVVLLTYGALTHAQTRVWRDSYTLWTTVLERAPKTGIAHANLAALLNARGEYPAACEHAKRALERLPGNRVAHVALGQAALNLGDYDTAERHLRIGMEIAAHIGKKDPTTLLALAAALTGQRRVREAESVYGGLLEDQADEPQWRFAYGGFLAAQDRYVDAQAQFAEVVRLDPGWAEAWYRLGVVRRHNAELSAARSALERGLAVSPNDVNLRAELAWVLATSPDPAVRDGARALSLASGAVRDSNERSLRAFEALAAAHAETGDFTAAVAVIEKALEGTPPPDEAATQSLASQLAKYRSGGPWREPPP